MEVLHTLNAQKWIDNYADTLYGYVCARVNNTGVAEDIVQETFLSAWRAKDTYNATASEKTWLFAICKNKIIDYYRKASTQKEVLAKDEETEDYFFADDGHWTKELAPKNWATNSETTVEKKEFYNILQLCKSKLKQIQQRVFTMKYLDDENTEVICQTLNISVQNYWVLMHRAKLQLRTCLQKNWMNM